MTKLPYAMEGTPTTPATEEGVRAFFAGLVAIKDTLVYSAPAQVALSITPSLASLLEQFCSTDPRYHEIMANIWINDYTVIKANGQEQQRRWPLFLRKFSR